MTMLLPITSLYGGICGLLLILLSLNVIRFRRKLGVNLGDGSVEVDRLPQDQHDEARKKYAPLGQAMRAQGNFVEYIPLALVLLAVAEIQEFSKIYLHAVGLSLVIGRIAHFRTITATVPRGPGRKMGTAATCFTIGVLGLSLIISSIRNL